MEPSELIAALGPTNTGKTFRALARMREHETGMIGLPLRLLAREVYEKLCGEVGEDRVALITGEEKKTPRGADYWVCTVEAMPMDREVDFLAVDEIQLASHHDRGHIFTDRLLSARGKRETWFIGSGSMESFVRRLLSTASIRRFPRMSRLRAEGSYTLGSLPKRSAIVAFSVPRVYELAERIRAKRGGAAIVLGALSPRARNAQVEMYQNGEVDYLVATDAIGLGLNLDIDRIAFADTRKFDGRQERSLELAELGQIAGRAGRYQSDGAFGTLAPREPLSDRWNRAIEEHQFPPIRALFYRNSDLDFSSARGLSESLKKPSTLPGLHVASNLTDTQTLELLFKSGEITRRVHSEDALRLLFEICQTPDYRKLLIEEHARVCGEIFTELVDRGVLGEEFLRRRIERLRSHSGDIEAITGRIASVRTWNYVTCRTNWVSSAQFQERTRELEDELSDDLHHALVERFVERKKRRPVSSPRRKEHGRFFHQLSELKAKLAGVELEEVDRSAAHLLSSEHSDLELAPTGSVLFRGERVASLFRGRRITEPQIRFVLDQFAHRPGDRRLAEERLRAFSVETVEKLLSALTTASRSSESTRLRGVFYQLKSGLGTVAGADAVSLLSSLSDDDRRQLDRAGVTVGMRSVYVNRLLKTPHLLVRRTLLQVWLERPVSVSDDELRRPSFVMRSPLACGDLAVLGFERFGRRAVRVDIVEKISTKTRGLRLKDAEKIVGSYAGVKKTESRVIARELSLGER